MKKRIVIGISGASGVIYGIEMLRLLAGMDIETHLIISESGKKIIEIETDYRINSVEDMASYTYSNMDLDAPIASGSFLTDGMVVVPCTIKTLSGIAHSYSDNLLIRSADVTLKEKRKLVLVVRETPLHKGHLKLMIATGTMILVMPFVARDFMPGYLELLPDDLAEQKVYLPDVMGYGWSIALVSALLGLWYWFVKWNDRTGRFAA